MMVLDHVGDQEAMVYAQLCQQPLVRTTETSLEPRRGTLSCLSARPPDLADLTVARPKVACVPLWQASHFYTPSARRRRDPSSSVMDVGRLNVLWPLRADHSWNYPGGGWILSYLYGGAGRRGHGTWGHEQSGRHRFRH